MAVPGKETIKNILGQIPFTAELYWLVRQRGGPIATRFSLRKLQTALPELVAQAISLREGTPVPEIGARSATPNVGVRSMISKIGMRSVTSEAGLQGVISEIEVQAATTEVEARSATPEIGMRSASPRKIFLFASLHYWIEHTTLLGLALAAQGHKPILGYVPYGDWQKPVNRFDLRRQNVYANRVLSQAEPLMEVVPFLNQRITYKRLPDEVMEAVRLVTMFDAQYALQVEEADEKSDIYRMRFERNLETARIGYNYLQNNRPDVVVVPNGTIQESGIIYRVARYLKIPTVTYEFGDQRQRIWLAQNSEVMRQVTDGMWKERSVKPLTPSQMERLHSLFVSRQRGALWENFSRLWQGSEALGGEQARQALGLDSRPVVLLATNVLGDSLTLGRQVFSKTMAEWISRTVQYFAGRPDVQLVIRIHPGEVLVHGQSMMDVVRQVMPRLPEHIRLIGPREKVNTYDLIEVADLGLIYTTTVGMEMAMKGLPVIVAGQTHFRGRGFTYDPESWVSYFKLLGHMLDQPKSYQLNHAQIERALQYIYGFFFDFPQPFPWHLVRMWEDYKSRPLSMVFNAEGKAQWADTFRYLAGEPIDWIPVDN